MPELCLCGCKLPIPPKKYARQKDQHFLIGHDQRAIQEIIKRDYGSIYKFVMDHPPKPTGRYRD